MKTILSMLSMSLVVLQTSASLAIPVVTKATEGFCTWEVRSEDAATPPLEDSMRLNKRMVFRGRSIPVPGSAHPRLVGELHLEIDHPFFNERWFPIDAVVNPDSVWITDPLSNCLSKLHCGLHVDVRTGDYYLTFLEPKHSQDDQDIALVAGGLTYDAVNDEFRILPLTKFQGRDLRGAAIGIKPDGSIRRLTGRLPFPTHIPSKTIAVEMAGQVVEDREKSKLDATVAVNIDFPALPQAVWNQLASRIQATTATSNDIDWQDKVLRQALAEFLDSNRRRKPSNFTTFQSQAATAVTYMDVKVPGESSASLLLGNLKLHYDPDFRTWWHYGELDLIGMGGNCINKTTGPACAFEYLVGARPGAANPSDTLRLYLEFDGMSWAYWECHGNTLRTISSEDLGYNAYIQAHPRRKGIAIEALTEADKDKFRARMVQRYIFREGRK